MNDKRIAKRTKREAAEKKQAGTVVKWIFGLLIIGAIGFAIWATVLVS
jgi:hypothetical protein